jgi:ADP-ribose pyrophosphatase YjhB (NUDIX family)
MWECTGGAVIAGEDSKQAVIREIREEIGVTVTEEQLTFMGSSTGNTFFVDCYALELDDIELSDLKLQREEVVNAKFVTLPEFLKMQSQRKIIPRLYDYMKQFNFDFVKE